MKNLRTNVKHLPRARPIVDPLEDDVFQWAVEEKIKSDKLPIFLRKVDAIVVSQETPCFEEAYKTIADTLEKRLEQNAEKIIPGKDAVNRKNLIILADLESIDSLPSHFKANLPELDNDKFDEFSIHSYKHEDSNIITVLGKNPRSMLYGAYTLASCIRTKGIYDIQTHEKSSFEIRMFHPALKTNKFRWWNWTKEAMEKNIRLLSKRRYNVFTLGCLLLRRGSWDFPRLLHFKEFPDLYTYDTEEERKEVELRVARNQKKLKDLITSCKRYGMDIAVRIAMASVPDDCNIDNFLDRHPEMEAKFNPQDDKTRDAYVDYILCLSNNMTHEFIASTYGEFFETFPDVKYVITEFGDDGASQECDCPRCKSYPYRNRVIDLTNLALSSIKRYNPDAKFILFEHRLPSLIGRQEGRDKYTDPGIISELMDQVPEKDTYCYIMWGCPPAGDCSWWGCKPILAGPTRDLIVFFSFAETAHFGEIGGFLCITSPEIHNAFSYMAENETMGIGLSEAYIGIDGFYVHLCMWNPGLITGDNFLERYSISRWGEERGQKIYHAIGGSYKTLEAFYNIDKKGYGYFHMFRWPESQDTYLGGYYCHHLPQEISGINRSNLSRILGMFKKAEEILPNIIESRKILCNIFKEIPADNEIKKLAILSRASEAITNYFVHYHHALVYYCLFKNEGGRNQGDRDVIINNLKLAVKDTRQYLECMDEITSIWGRVRNDYRITVENAMKHMVIQTQFACKCLDNKLWKYASRELGDPERYKLYWEVVGDFCYEGLKQRHMRKIKKTDSRLRDTMSEYEK